MIRLLIQRTQIVALACLLACAFATGSISAHPFHTSVAELDWNAVSGRWEVSVRIHAADLELALARHFEQKLDLESTGAAQWIEQYVESRFQLVPQDVIARQLAASEGQRTATRKTEISQIDWVGQETEGGWMWLYFELLPPQSERPLALVSQLLTEINEDQINLVSIRNVAKKRTTQQTSRKQLWIAL